LRGVELWAKTQKHTVTDSRPNNDRHRGLATTSKFLNASLNSHVLLAACGELETARERHGHGLFTLELIRHLKLNGIGSFTYEELVRSLGPLAR